VTRVGRSVPIPYNGSVSRLTFGPRSATRILRWLRDGDFDVLHLHSPETFSLSLLTLMNARGPIVATFHASNPRSRILSMLQSPLQIQLEKLSGRIAVSPAARTTIVEHLGGDAVVVPNGVDVGKFRGAEPLPGWPGPGGAIGFLGRLDETRKGLVVLLDAFADLARERPGLRLLVAGPGDFAKIGADLDPEVRARVTLLGQIDEPTKARMLASVDVYVAPNTGAESFGIVLLEAMAAGTPIVASGLDAFRRVLAPPSSAPAAVFAAPGDAASLADALREVLGTPSRRAELVAAGAAIVGRYDWSVVTDEVVRVYETAIAMHRGRRVSEMPEAVHLQGADPVVRRAATAAASRSAASLGSTSRREPRRLRGFAVRSSTSGGKRRSRRDPDR
jgi:phosphatidylinositol alpha-mannosyltransferase